MDENVWKASNAGSSGPASPSFVNDWVSEYKQRINDQAPNQVVLPSGKQVMCSRMPLHLLWSRGRVPDTLTSNVQKYIEAIESQDETKARNVVKGDNEELTEEEAKVRLDSWIGMIDFVWCTCVTEPKFVEKIEDQDLEKSILWVGGVDYLDRMYIFQYAQGVDQTVEAFFLEQRKAMGTLSAVEPIPMPTKSNHGDTGGNDLAGVSTGSSNVRVG